MGLSVLATVGTDELIAQLLFSVYNPMSEEDKDYLEAESSETPPKEDYSQEETLEEGSADSEVPSEEATDGDEEDEKVSRYKQQLKGNKEEALKFRKMIFEEEIVKAWKDANAVLELYKKDPKLALEVAAHYDFDSIEAIENHIAKQRSPDEPISEEEIERRVERLANKKVAEKQHTIAKENAVKRFNKLPKEAKEIAIERFEKLTEGKILDVSEAQEMAEMVTLYVQKEDFKSTKISNAKAKMSSTWLRNSKKMETGGEIVVDWKLLTLDK